MTSWRLSTMSGLKVYYDADADFSQIKDKNIFGIHK